MSLWTCWECCDLFVSFFSISVKCFVAAYVTKESYLILQQQSVLQVTDKKTPIYHDQRNVLYITVFTQSPTVVAKYCNTSVWLFVCLSVREHISGTTCPIFTKFLCMLPMAVARFSSGSVAICYVLPLLLTTAYLHVARRKSASWRIYSKWLNRGQHWTGV